MNDEMKTVKIIGGLTSLLLMGFLMLSFAKPANAETLCRFAPDSAECQNNLDPNQQKAGLSNFALTCSEALNGVDGKAIISRGGLIASFCDGDTSNNTIIQVVLQKFINWLSFIGLVLFSIMIALAGIQVTVSGSSPEALKSAKRRISLAVSSIALMMAGNVVLGLVGITGNQFLGVPLDRPGGFSIDIIYEIIVAALQYLQFAGAALSIGFLMVGGAKMMTSTGNPQAIQAARKTITYALLGFAITMGTALISALVSLVIKGV